ncbi:MAG: hypothetical protein WHT82_12710 [Limisphaera sp.]
MYPANSLDLGCAQRPEYFSPWDLQHVPAIGIPTVKAPHICDHHAFICPNLQYMAIKYSAY